jgi:hypothetical protein
MSIAMKMAQSNLHQRLKYYRRQVSEMTFREPRTLLYGAMLALGIAAFIFSFSLATKDDRATSPVSIVAPPLVPVDDALGERKRRTEFFESRVLADLETTDSSNRLAATRCIRRIEQNFQQYRDGVDGFVEELTGLKARLGILRRMPGDWWNGEQQAGVYVTEKFERHLFSEEKLTGDLRDALEGFREEIRANHLALLSRTQAAIDQSDLPPIKLEEYETFFAVVTKHINDLANNEAQTSVSDGLVTLLVSEAGSTAVGMIAGRLITSLGASTAATVATTGGATAGGAAAGAAGGSLIPGPGTVVGFGVGLVAGFGIDYWMNEQTAAKLRTELLLYINAMESDLLLGPVVESPGSQAPQGVQVGIDAVCERLRDGVHQRLYEIIVLEKSL